MKEIVINLTNVDAKSTLASNRIATFVAKTLDLPLKDKSSGKAEKYDRIFLVNGPPAFCSWREELAEMVDKSRDLVFIQNDYTIYPPSQVNKVMRKKGWVNEKGHVTPPVRWSTIQNKIINPRDRYINWNSLTYSNKFDPETKVGNRIFYYGAYREGREEYFERYFRTEAYKILVSGSARATARFRELNGGMEIVKPFQNISECAGIGMTIYMEDRYSHKHYCSPANRFYECLSYGIPQVFDVSSANTMVEAGMPEVEKWVVYSVEDVSKFLRNRKRIAREQHDHWHKNYVLKLRNAVKKAYKEL